MKVKINKVMAEKFNSKLKWLMKRKTKRNKIMTKPAYSLMIKRVTAAKEKTPSSRTADQKKCLRKYDIVKVGSKEKLIAPIEHEGETPLYFVHDKELFFILHRLHIRKEHASANRMLDELKMKYNNITREIVLMYVKTCATCVRKAREKRSMIEKEIERKKNLTRGQLECMAMYPRGRSPSYRVLMMYHDHVNMYDVARPLESMDTDRIAKIMCDIFSVFGTPDILQSTKERPFIRDIVKNLEKYRPGIKIEPEEIKYHDLFQAIATGAIISRDPNDLDIGDIFQSWTNEIAERLGANLSSLVEGKLARRTGETPNPYDGLFVRNLKTSPRWSHLTGYILDKIKAENLVENRKPVVRLYNKSYF